MYTVKVISLAGFLEAGTLASFMIPYKRTIWMYKLGTGTGQCFLWCFSKYSDFAKFVSSGD